MLGLCAGAGTVVLAGCIGGGGGDGTAGTPTETGTATAGPTTSPAGSPTGTQEGLEYTVTNEDDESHRVEVTLTTADGTVVHETAESLAAGESLSGTSTGNDPERGPHELTVALESTSVTSELKFEECPAYNFGFSITPDGTISVDREVCQK